MTSQLERLDKGLLIQQPEFEVREGPFTCYSSDLISFAKEVFLHIKWVPRHGGPFDPKLKLIFYKDKRVFYSKLLGRRPLNEEIFCNRMYKYTPPSISKLMDMWKEIEQLRRIKDNFSIQPIRIEVKEIVKTVNQLDTMDELDLLKHINKQRKDVIKKLEKVAALKAA